MRANFDFDVLAAKYLFNGTPLIIRGLAGPPNTAMEASEVYKTFIPFRKLMNGDDGAFTPFMLYLAVTESRQVWAFSVGETTDLTQIECNPVGQWDRIEPLAFCITPQWASKIKLRVIAWHTSDGDAMECKLVPIAPPPRRIDTIDDL